MFIQQYKHIQAFTITTQGITQKDIVTQGITQKDIVPTH